MRTCKLCGELLPLTDEYFYKDVKGDKTYFKRKCISCYNLKSKATNNKTNDVANYKTNDVAIINDVANYKINDVANNKINDVANYKNNVVANYKINDVANKLTPSYKKTIQNFSKQQNVNSSKVIKQSLPKSNIIPYDFIEKNSDNPYSLFFYLVFLAGEKIFSMTKNFLQKDKTLDFPQEEIKQNKRQKEENPFFHAGYIYSDW